MTEREIMLTSVLNCTRTELYSKNLSLNSCQMERFNGMVKRREAGEPLQYVIGEWNFCGLDLFITEQVLIPRPETELLVEGVLNFTAREERPLSVLDLGTGSGNIAVSLAKFLQGSFITALDISPRAVDLARRNAARNSVQERIDFVVQDMGSYLKDCNAQGRTFDVIVSNPPYIAKGNFSQLPREVKKEPFEALYGGVDGLDFFKIILSEGINIIKDGGCLAFEIGDGQSKALQSLMERSPLISKVHCIADYTRTDRVLIAQVFHSSLPK